MEQKRLKDLTSELKASLEKILKNKMADLILFGSFARGEGSDESDVDFVLLLNQPLSKSEEEIINQIFAQLSLKYDTVVVCLDYLIQEFEQSSSSFLQKVKQEGIRV